MKRKEAMAAMGYGADVVPIFIERAGSTRVRARLSRGLRRFDGSSLSGMGLKWVCIPISLGIVTWLGIRRR